MAIFDLILLTLIAMLFARILQLGLKHVRHYVSSEAQRRLEAKRAKKRYAKNDAYYEHFAEYYAEKYRCN